MSGLAKTFSHKYLCGCKVWNVIYRNCFKILHGNNTKNKKEKL